MWVSSTDTNSQGSMNDSNTLWRVSIRISSKKAIWIRKVYQVLDMLGDIGGFSDALFMIAEAFMGYYAPALFL